MIPVLYQSNETEFKTNGLGRLTDCISCEVKEGRNGVYEAEFVYPITGLHYDDIEIGCIVYTTHDALKQPEPFDIYKRSAPIDGKVTFYAHHISYRLNEMVVKPFTITGTAGEALNALKANSVNPCAFTFESDKATRLTYSVSEPNTIRRLLGGVEGSVLDVYGGDDYEFNLFNVRLATRGADRGVTVRYGKNMTDLTAEKDAEGAYNGVVPYWAQGGTVVTLPEWYVVTDGVTIPRLAPLNLTDEWVEAPTAAQLRAKAQERLASAKPWTITETIEVEFEPLWQTDEYADVEGLQRVAIGDTVGIYFKDLGVSVKSRVIKTVYNPLKGMYTSVEIGDPQTSLADTIQERTADLIARRSVTPGFVTDAITQATNKITGGLGGYVVLGRSQNGTPEEILVMDTADTQTAVNVIRINKNGIGFSSTGYQGPFTSAWTIDGVFNTDYIVVNSLSTLSQNAGTITAGVLRSIDYEYVTGNRYTTHGMIVDLDNKIIRTPKTAILGDGSIYSTSVDLEGKITATSGSIGPWQISANAIYNGLSSSTGSDSGIYIGTNGIYGLSTDKMFRWNFYLSGSFILTDLKDSDTSTAILRLRKEVAGIQSITLPWGFRTYVDGEAIDRVTLTTESGHQRLRFSDGTTDMVAIGTYNGNSYLYMDVCQSGSRQVRINTGSFSSMSLWSYDEEDGVYFSSGGPSMEVKASGARTLIRLTRGTTSYGIIYSPNNGNISIGAAGGVLYIGENTTNTTGINFLNGKVSIDASGVLYIGTANAGKAINNITRSGTTFTATRLDGTTFTFTQQDNNSVTGVKGNAETSYRTGNVNLTPANIGALALTGGTLTGSLTINGNLTFANTSDLGIVQGYNSTTKYNILRNHGNGNVSLSACSAGLYLGYEQTTFVDFLNGKISLNSQGHLTVTGEVHAGGKGNASDGKAGSILSTAGHLYMQGASGSHIYFYYGTSKTVTSQLYESASGTLRVSGDFTIEGVIRVPKTWDNTTTNSANVRVIDQYGQLQRYTSSSKRYKHSIKQIKNYKDVLDINVVTFVYNKDYLSEGDPRYGTPIPGFIAEDVAEKYPIAADVIGGKVEDWNARYIIPPMLAVEQDHEKRIASLEKENADMRAEIAKLKGVA